jgi:protein-disulfide isomerase
MRSGPTMRLVAGRVAAWVWGMAVMLVGFPVAAGTPVCDELSGPKRELAQGLLSSQHPYDCCDESIARCLEAKRVCSLAYRLAERICSRVAAGQSRKAIVRALSLRARSMMPLTKPAKISLDGFEPVGEEGSPVELVEYACARCPFCAKATPKLYDLVTKGPLKGKVRFYFKPFPIRYHEHAKVANLGLMAAMRLGRFWPFMQHVYRHFDAFSPQKQPTWAEKSGLKRSEFTRVLGESKTREMLVASKKEGLRNGVDATPTFFISRRRYVGDHDVAELIDVLEEEYERLRRIEYRK